MWVYFDRFFFIVLMSFLNLKFKNQLSEFFFGGNIGGSEFVFVEVVFSGAVSWSTFRKRGVLERVGIYVGFGNLVILGLKLLSQLELGLEVRVEEMRVNLKDFGVSGKICLRVNLRDFRVSYIVQLVVRVLSFRLIKGDIGVVQ